jgi:uncharacterized protein (TIGR02147 family)
VSPSAATLLKSYFERKKKSRPGFSLRSFAKAMDLSPSFVSGLLSGKKPIPLSRIPQLSRLLDLDSLAITHLKRALAQEALQSQGHDLVAIAPEAATKKYKLGSKSQFSLLSPWYNVPIMDLTTCANFEKDPAWIARQLGLSRYQVEQALLQLTANGFLKETKKGFKKIEDKMRISSNESHVEIRKFHGHMIDRAKEELFAKTTKADFDRREITGITIAADPKNIEKARQRLVEALHEVAEILSEGELTELYQINAQLFSLLKK